jgi:ubiquinone/menaquinone biosynthesis C-methylase UbiE
MIARLKNALGRIRGLIFGEPPEIRAWRLRAEQLNARAVFNAGHGDAELDQVTERQKDELYPRLRKSLNGTERVALDFGCGTGRFSGDLAALISGRVIAVDPVQRLLDLAPSHAGVEYRRMKTGRIPTPSGSIDLAWICLVLGGIRGAALDATRREIARVVSTNGLVFLVENTTAAKNSEFWAFRTVEEYTTMIPGVSLACLGHYDDLGERISIFAGRKSPSA